MHPPHQKMSWNNRKKVCDYCPWFLSSYYYKKNKLERFSVASISNFASKAWTCPVEATMRPGFANILPVTTANALTYFSGLFVTKEIVSWQWSHALNNFLTRKNVCIPEASIFNILWRMYDKSSHELSQAFSWENILSFMYLSISPPLKKFLQKILIPPSLSQKLVNWVFPNG
jgi:hypothetical protein